MAVYGVYNNRDTPHFIPVCGQTDEATVTPSCSSVMDNLGIVYDKGSYLNLLNNDKMWNPDLPLYPGDSSLPPRDQGEATPAIEVDEDEETYEEYQGHHDSEQDAEGNTESD